jgi:hypothetical protein
MPDDCFASPKFAISENCRSSFPANNLKGGHSQILKLCRNLLLSDSSQFHNSDITARFCWAYLCRTLRRLNFIRYELQHCNLQADGIFMPHSEGFFHKQSNSINILFLAMPCCSVAFTARLLKYSMRDLSFSAASCPMYLRVCSLEACMSSSKGLPMSRGGRSH